ncbi:MAG TPA: hypothetical protein VM848_17710 [Acidimicrobiia bacterium]|nr:hypothetical protein [Acidimicrobiia bacterium]
MMSLERRIREALHATDDYQPSIDLFARLQRSIEEDRAHRRRLLEIAITSALGLLVLGLFVVATSQRSPGGVWTAPKWSLQAVIEVVLVTILITVGPALRRLGGPLLDDVFRLRPDTGVLFSKLLDIAYYLFFGGFIVINFDPADLHQPIAIPSEELWLGTAGIAAFLLFLGVAHVANLAVLPIIGLLFTSLARRAARRDAGSSAPPESPTAKRADRVALAFVITAALLALAGALVLVGFILIGVAID